MHISNGIPYFAGSGQRVIREVMSTMADMTDVAHNRSSAQPSKPMPRNPLTIK